MPRFVAGMEVLVQVAQTIQKANVRQLLLRVRTGQLVVSHHLVLEELVADESNVFIGGLHDIEGAN